MTHTPPDPGDDRDAVDGSDTQIRGDVSGGSRAAATDDDLGWLSEPTLVGRAQDGDVRAFETLMRRYSGPVFGLAQRTLTDRGDAEDVVQDTFIMVWRRLPTLNDPALFRAWVYQIATHRCLNVLRARARRPSAPTADDDLEVASAGTMLDRAAVDDPAAAAQHAAQLDGLDNLLRTLPDEQRVCWVLREMNELSYPEIAYATHLPVSTVRGRIARARQNLVKGMDSWR